jgi:hypothetical protein
MFLSQIIVEVTCIEHETCSALGKYIRHGFPLPSVGSHRQTESLLTVNVVVKVRDSLFP